MYVSWYVLPCKVREIVEFHGNCFDSLLYFVGTRTVYSIFCWFHFLLIPFFAHPIFCFCHFLLIPFSAHSIFYSFHFFPHSFFCRFHFFLIPFSVSVIFCLFHSLLIPFMSHFIFWSFHFLLITFLLIPFCKVWGLTLQNWHTFLPLGLPRTKYSLLSKTRYIF